MTERCPACGSDQLVSEKLARRYSPPFGDPLDYDVPMIACRTCDEGFEAEGASDVVKRAEEAANRSSVKAMVEQLEKRRITMAYMERVLGLAPRTIARWKTGEISAAGLALLRIVRTFPWILRVASARFDQVTARRLLSAEVFSIRNSSGTLRTTSNLEAPVTPSIAENQYGKAA